VTNAECQRQTDTMDLTEGRCVLLGILSGAKCNQANPPMYSFLSKENHVRSDSGNSTILVSYFAT
jgi:hypothetical protein